MEVREKITKELYDSEDFKKLKTPEEMCRFILHHYADSIESSIAEMRTVLTSHREKNNHKSRSISKMFESAADELVQSKVNFDMANIENLYTKAIASLPPISDVIGEKEKSCKNRVRLFTKRAKLRYEMKQYEDALGDIYSAIRFRDNGLGQEKRGYMLDILAMQCLSDLKLIDESDKRKIEKIVLELQNNSDLGLLIPNELSDLISKHCEKYSNKSNWTHPERLDTARVDGKSDSSYFLYEVDSRWITCVHNNRGRFARAIDDIPEGTVLLVEKPYSAVLRERWLQERCNYCMIKIDNPNLAYPCECCNEAIFCSIGCFEEAYSVYHQYECGFLGLILQMNVCAVHVYRIFSRIGLENVLEYDRNFQPSSYTVEEFRKNEAVRTKPPLELSHEQRMALYRMSTSLVEHSEKYSSTMNAYHAAKAYDLTRMMAVQNPELFEGENLENNFYQLFKLCFVYIRRVVVNVFGQFEYIGKTRENIANCECLFASFVNHSCDPNITWEIKHGHIIFRAKRRIKKNEELNITYGQTKVNPFLRRQINLQSYYFFCKCSLCVADVRQLKTILCPECQNGPIIFASSRNGCQECQEVVKNGQQLMTKLEKELKLIEWNRKLVSGATAALAVENNGLMGDEKLCQRTLQVIDSAKEYLLDNMYRSDVFEAYVEDLAQIYLFYSRLDSAMEMAQIICEQMDDCTCKITDLSLKQLETQLIKYNFWTEVCNRYFAKCMAQAMIVDDQDIVLATVQLFIRFIKLACIFLEQHLSNLDSKDDTVDGSHEHNESFMLLKLSDKKKTMLINIVDFVKSSSQITLPELTNDNLLIQLSTKS